MKIYPAVDIKDGKCVRLKMGDASNKTVYFENPLDAAKSFAEAGSKVIHVVDLDGAFGGSVANMEVISQIAGLGMFVELGGGLRDEASVRRAFDAGVGRAIIGTKACTNPEFAISLAEKYGEKIAVGIDAQGGQVAMIETSNGFIVADNGPGILPEDRDRIFEAFTRGNTACGSGEGLGLSIVSRICERMGWTARLLTEQDKPQSLNWATGAVFIVTLAGTQQRRSDVAPKD